MSNLLGNSKNSWQKFYKYVRNKKGNRENISFLKGPSNNYITNSRAIADLFNEYFLSVFNYESWFELDYDDDTRNLFKIEPKKVRKHVKLMGNRKSVGPDGTPTEIIKLGGNQW